MDRIPYFSSLPFIKLLNPSIMLHFNILPSNGNPTISYCSALINGNCDWIPYPKYTNPIKGEKKVQKQ